MPLISEALTPHDEATRRRLYTLFQREVKAGRLPALRLLSHFDITGSKGQPRRVTDYAYPTSAAGQVDGWIERHTKPVRQQGLTAHEALALSDDELSAMIRKTQSKGRRSGPRRPSGKSPAASSVEAETVKS